MAVKSSDPIDILLEMGIDLDNLSEEEDYLSALKEAIATIQFQTKGGGDERSAILSQEVIKVRKSRKAADPKFKAKKTTIKPDAFFDKKKPEDQAQPVPGQKALPGSSVVKGGAIVKPSDIKPPEKEEEKDTKLLPGNNILKDILGGVNSILGTLQNQNKSKKKQSEKDRKSKEKKKRGAQEDKLEKGPLKKFAGGAKKLLKPVTNFFAEVLKFIGTVLIGRLLVKIINWMGDEKNAKKMDAIQDFFMATWPAFLAVFLAFSLGLGGFITSIIGLVGGFALKIAKLVPMMLKGLTTLALGNPIATAIVAGTALAAVGAIAPMVAPQTVEDDADKQANKAVDEKGTEKAAADIRQQNADRGFFGKIGDVFTGAGQEREEQAQRIEGKPEKKYGFFGEIKPKEMKDGGQVPGSGPNKDTVPAMLSPGEFVMSRGAVNKYGSDTMESMNAMGGGTNRPIIKDGVTYATTGGGIGDARVNTETKSTNVGDSIVAGAKRIIGTGKGIADQCANTTRAALKSAGHPAARKVTAKGDLDSPKGTAYNAPSFAASFGGTDMGKVITQKSNIKKGDMLLWRANVDKGGIVNKGAITHVGIAADDGLKHQYDHNTSRGFHYRPHWDTFGGTSWFAGIRLGGSGGMTPPEIGEDDQSGGNDAIEPGDPRTSLSPASSSGGGSSSSSDRVTQNLNKLKTHGSSNAPKYKKVNTGSTLLDLYNEQERSAGRSEGFKPGGLKFKKPPSSTSDLENNSRSTTNMQQKGAEGAGGMGNQSNASPNPAAFDTAPSNDLPSIDANAMVSQEKIKVLGITVV